MPSTNAAGSRSIVYRLPSAKFAIVALVACGLGVAVWSVLDPRILPFTAACVVAAWVTWFMWILPSVTVSDDDIHVVNPFRVGTVPLRSVTSVTGGESLILKTPSGSIRASAAGGRGGSPMTLKANDYRSQLGPMGSNGLDPERGEGDTPATRIARTIRRRIKTLTPRGEDRVATFRVNGLTLLVGAVAALVACALVLIP